MFVEERYEKKNSLDTLCREYSYEYLQNWSECKKTLKNAIPEPFYSHFIEPLVAFKDQEDNIILYTENEKLQNHIEIRYSEVIKSIVYNFYKESLRINRILFFHNKRIENPNTIKHYTRKQSSTDHQQETSIWNYDIFYPAKSNYAELTNLIKLEKFFRPIYIYGYSGSGKTSLARIWKQQHPNKVFYITTPNFISEYVLAIKKKNSFQWIETIKTYPIFILDDFQFLKASALKCQEEIRNLIDHYYEKNHIFIIMADRDFHFLKLEKDLFSRLLTFYKIQLHYPDPETKIKLLKHYLEKYNLHLQDNIIEHIAMKINGDVRYLQSSVEKLHLYSATIDKLKTSDIDFLLENYYEKNLILDINTIMKIICEHYNTPLEEVLGNHKNKKIALIRHITAYIAVKIGNYTLSQTAKYLKRKDHTSILYAIKKIEEQLQHDLFLQKEIEAIKEKIYLYQKEI